MADKELQDVPLWFVRAGVIVALVPCLIWVAVSTLLREMRPVPKYVWWACCDLNAGMKFMWEHGRAPDEGEW